MIYVFGVPYDEGSSFLKGSRLGPQAIREAFWADSCNTFSENEVELGNNSEVEFVDDLEFTADADPLSVIQSEVNRLLDRPGKVLSLGGDHSVTFPILKAHAKQFGPLNLLQLDAHPDLYDSFDGNPFSHACPFARAHEAGLLKRHVQMGIRTMTTHQRAQANHFDVEVIAMKDWEKHISAIKFQGPTYVTLDLDVLDPAFAPGISHYEPGGATVRQVIEVIQNSQFDWVGSDIVELNPDRDFQSMTAMVAAKLMKEMLARMMS